MWVFQNWKRDLRVGSDGIVYDFILCKLVKFLIWSGLFPHKECWCNNIIFTSVNNNFNSIARTKDLKTIQCRAENLISDVSVITFANVSWIGISAMAIYTVILPVISIQIDTSIFKINTVTVIWISARKIVKLFQRTVTQVVASETFIDIWNLEKLAKNLDQQEGELQRYEVK